jgi:sulfopyruvate decarboxylase subunit alpha
MNQSAARLVVDALKKNDIRLLTVLPDSWMFEVYELACNERYFKVVPVTHEAEGVCICAGAWCGGLRAAIVMENSGLRAATEALGRLYCFPVLLLMSYRGDLGDRAFFGRPIGRTTEPLLQALGIPYVTIRKEGEIETAVRDATQTLDTALGPVALLFSGETVR